LGDDEIVGGRSPTPVLSLMSMLGATTHEQLEVLGDDNSDAYWQASDHFDMALDLTSGGRGSAALSDAMRRWIFHLLGIEVVIEPLTGLRDAKLNWYIGLDAEATRMGDQLWRGEALDERAAGRVLALFRLFFADQGLVAN